MKTILKPTPQEIALKAYQLWEQDGCKHGRDTQYWLQAEKELCTKAGTAATNTVSALTSVAAPTQTAAPTIRPTLRGSAASILLKPPKPIRVRA